MGGATTRNETLEVSARFTFEAAVKVTGSPPSAPSKLVALYVALVLVTFVSLPGPVKLQLTPLPTALSVVAVKVKVCP
jgi:hypothetical protein